MVFIAYWLAYVFIAGDLYNGSNSGFHDFGWK
jgi:hypothetical protein